MASSSEKGQRLRFLIIFAVEVQFFIAFPVPTDKVAPALAVKER
jgi:hypothetical protein